MEAYLLHQRQQMKGMTVTKCYECDGLGFVFIEYEVFDIDIITKDGFIKDIIAYQEVEYRDMDSTEMQFKNGFEYVDVCPYCDGWGKE